jgi:Amidases related to nicotinamidase
MTGAATTVTKEGLADWIRPSRTAVLIIDMQVDFAAPDGSCALGGCDMSAVPAALAAAERLAGAARKVGALVVFPRLWTEPATDSLVWKERRRRAGQEREDARYPCRAGSYGAEFYGPLPQEGDLIVSKTKYSAFFGTELDALLAKRSIDTLVFAGLTTECCVDSSVRDACHLDYHIFIAADACAAYDEEMHRQSLAVLELNCGILTDVASVEAAWRLA